VAARLAEHAAEERRREELFAERARLVEERAQAWEHLYDPPPDGTLDVRDIAARRAGIEHLGRRIVAQDAAIAEADRRVAEAAERVERARADLTAAARGLTAIDKHRDAWKQEVLTELARKEEQLAGEVSLSAYVRREKEEA
jgi:hypothetical protein